jgi:ABC-2 type transport system ATP-binding protein
MVLPGSQDSSSPSGTATPGAHLAAFGQSVVTDAVPLDAAAGDPSRTIFTADRVAKYYGKITALNGVTLAVEPGAIGLLGPNGAGKSTLISVLLGQTPLSSGTATVLGLDVQTQQGLIRQRIGYMPENDCLISGMTGTGYVYYAGRMSGMEHADAMQRTHEVLDYVDLGEARYRPAEQYSTGMKQRLKLAQALVHDPDLVFLDEPTNGMDPEGRQAMLNLISDLDRAGISVLLSSHLLPDVERVCTHVVIMGAGEVLQTGRLAEMRRPHPTMYSVVFTGAAEPYQRQLAAHGVRLTEPSRPEGDAISQPIELPAADQESVLLAAAQEAGVQIRGLHPKRSSLEEAFMAALQKQRTS